MDAATDSLLRDHKSSFSSDSRTQCGSFHDSGSELDSEIGFEKVTPGSFPDHHRRNKMAGHVVAFGYVFAILLVVVGFCIAVAYILEQVPQLRAPEVQSGPSIEWKTCGSTSEEARNLGCRLDFIDRNWVPKECFDAEMVEEFLGEDNWHWYTSATGDEEVSQMLLERGEGPPTVWVTDEYHWTHCQYSWMKMHRAVLEGKPMDTELNSYKHTRHCAKDLALHYSEPHGRAQFTLGFTSCPVSIR